jgi:two-component system nitrogen regulation sensor histidine kinase GlnL
MVDQPLAPLVEQLSTGILRLDSALRVVFLNPAAEQLLGSSRKQLQGRILDKAVPSFGSLRPFLERSVRTGEGFAQRELSVEVPGPAGENTVLDCTIGEYRADRDDGLVVELTDASRRLRISRENALLSQLEASRCIVRQLAHEIRNPLGGIRGAAQLLERELPGPSLQEFTGVIIRESDRLAGLASNMLGPGAPPDRESLNIHEIVEHVFRLTSAEAATGIRVERDYDPSLPTLSLDRAQVIQALLNLSGNALQAIGEEGRIIFRTRALSHYTIGVSQHRLVACVEVEDTGPGVPENLQETLFYPLITGRPGGTGLGLALAQGLVTRQGGMIEYTSRPGRTVFQMFFPIEASDDSTSA